MYGLGGLGMQTEEESLWAENRRTDDNRLIGALLWSGEG